MKGIIVFLLLGVIAVISLIWKYKNDNRYFHSQDNHSAVSNVSLSGFASGGNDNGEGSSS